MQVGQSKLDLSTSSFNPENSSQIEAGAGRRSASVSLLADINVVPVGSGDAAGTSTVPPSLQNDFDASHQQPDDSLPRAIGGLSYFRESLAKTCPDMDFNSEELQFLSNHISKGSASTYACAWEKLCCVLCN